MSQLSPSSQPTPVRPPALEPLPPPTPTAGEVWWDDQRPSSSWNAPTWWDAVSGRAKVWTALALAVVLVGTVWAAGGFKEGGVKFRSLAAGQVIASGPFELTFHRATWEFSEYANNSGGWRLTVHGTCRNRDITSKRNLDLDLAEAVMIGGYHDGIVHLAADDVVKFGIWGRGEGMERHDLAPGLPPMPCAVTGLMKPGFEPQAFAVVGVYDLFWNDSNDVQTGGQRWQHRDTGKRTQVPAVVLVD